MAGSGTLRAQLARTLRAAYADGLLSDGTFSYRLERLLSDRVLDPARLVGDLNLRGPTWRWATRATTLMRRLAVALTGDSPRVLALDWDGASEDLLIGRHPDCDVVLSSLTVSRHHARLTYRDGRWILRDLNSTNGTTVNRSPVAVLRPWRLSIAAITSSG